MNKIYAVKRNYQYTDDDNWMPSIEHVFVSFHATEGGALRRIDDSIKADLQSLAMDRLKYPDDRDYDQLEEQASANKVSFTVVSDGILTIDVQPRYFIESLDLEE